jgi:PAS domain S-box-containing protein
VSPAAAQPANAAAPAAVPAASGSGGPKPLDDRLLYRALMESLYDATLVVSSSGHIVDANGRAYRLLGYEAGYLWHVPVSTILPSITADIIDQVRQHTAEDRFTVLNAACGRQDGTTFHAEIAIRCTRLINANDLVFCVRDVDRQRKARERYQSEVQAARGSAAGLLVCDAAGVVRYANAAFALLTGLANESAAVGRPLVDFLPSPEGCDDLLTFAAQTGSCTAERLVRDAAGDQVPVIVTVSHQDGGSPELNASVVTLIGTAGLRTATIRLRTAPPAASNPAP